MPDGDMIMTLVWSMIPVTSPGLLPCEQVRKGHYTVCLPQVRSEWWSEQNNHASKVDAQYLMYTCMYALCEQRGWKRSHHVLIERQMFCVEWCCFNRNTLAPADQQSCECLNCTAPSESQWPSQTLTKDCNHAKRGTCLCSKSCRLAGCCFLVASHGFTPSVQSSHSDEGPSTGCTALAKAQGGHGKSANHGVAKWTMQDRADRKNGQLIKLDQTLSKT